MMTVVGMGVTGLSCARFFAARNIPFRVVDSRDNPPMKAVFEADFPQVKLQCGQFHQGLFGPDDTLVVSPGMALDEPAIATALVQGAVLTSDIELFLNEADAPIVAITGSNGKSTVTTLVGEMFTAAGKKASVAGNIGVPVLEQLLHKEKYDVYVLELSSFQLERLPDLSATAVTILNITEDHMDRYDTLQDYVSAKQRIFMHARHVVFNRQDRLTWPPAGQHESLVSFGLSVPAEGEFGLVQSQGREWIAFGAEKLFPVDELKIRGLHNVANAMASMALCRCLGMTWAPMLDALRNFSGLRHRCEWVAEIKGVNFYNDSKATNVGAAVAAIGGFDVSNGRLLLIAGGQDKDSDFSPLARVVREKVAHVYLIGKDAPKLEQAIGESLCSFHASLGDAVLCAFTGAKSGDVVLLAPACASFDMFRNYEDRGEQFVRVVREMAA